MLYAGGDRGLTSPGSPHHVEGATVGLALVALVAGWTDYALGGAVDENLDPPLPIVPYGAVQRKTEQWATAPEHKWEPDGPAG